MAEARPGPGPAGAAERALAALVEDAGFEPGALATLRFGDVDSLLAAEAVLAVEEHLGRRLAIEAFTLDTPLRDLLAIVAPP